MSSNELMLALSNEVERNERYDPPPAHTRAGQIDRKHEREHSVTIRDYERTAREQVAAAAVEAVADIAWLQARAKVNTEAKFLIERADKESTIIAGDDPLKKAKFDILDDEYFMQLRCRANKSNPQTATGLFE